MSSVRKLEPGRTLLLDGPASATVISGLASVFGAELKPRQKVIVRRGRRIPIEALEPTELEIVVGQGGSVAEVEIRAIPSSWEELAKEAISKPSPTRIMVLGAIDTGKTSFCTYLANMALKAGRSVGIVDADVGQSDIGPPCTIGFAQITKPVKDLSEVRAQHIFFLGDKTPSHLVDRALEGIKAMLEVARGVDFLVVNTDGWVSGPGAVEYKKAIASLVEPSVIAVLARGNELDHMLRALENWPTRAIEVPPLVKERDREIRRELRAQGYRRYLENAKVISISLDWVEVDGHLPGSGLRPSRERVELISSILGIDPLYCEEDLRRVTLVFDEEGPLPEQEAISRLEEEVGKEVEIVMKGQEKNLLVSLHDEDGRFLGLGIIVCIDYRKRIIRIFTPADEDAVAKICVGRIRVGEDGNELEAPQLKSEGGQID